MNDHQDWIDRVLFRLPEPEKADRFIFWFCFVVGAGLLALAFLNRIGACT